MKIFKFFFPLFALFVLFEEELFYSSVSLFGLSLESGMKSREAIIIAAFAYIMLFFDINHKRLSVRNSKQLFALLVILVLYIISGLMYPHNANYNRYFAHLLSYVSISIPACYVGMRLAREKCQEMLFNLLPFVIVPIVIIVISAVFSSSVNNELLGREDEDVFNYQNASYFLSFCYSYCFFYVFLMNKDIKSVKGVNIKNVVMVFLMFVCAIGCILGGGRGAFVFIVFISAYLIWRLIRQSGKNTHHRLFLLLMASIIMVYLAVHLHVFESSGFLRVSETLTEDDYRMAFIQKALNVFGESPFIGHGIGSIWWTVGFYSHNMLMDFLAETGIIGTIILVTVLFRMFLLLIRWSHYDSLDMFMLIVFLGALVHDSFSGYWISSPKFFMIFGYVFAIRKQFN